MRTVLSLLLATMLATTACGSPQAASVSAITLASGAVGGYAGHELDDGGTGGTVAGVAVGLLVGVFIGIVATASMSK